MGRRNVRNAPAPCGLAPAWLAVSVAGALAGIAGCLAAGVHVAQRMVVPSPRASTPVLVLGVSGQRQDPRRIVRLGGEDAGLPGSRYSLLFDQNATEPGHARLGAILRESPPHGEVANSWVERELIGVDRGDLRVGTRGRITGWWYPAALSLDPRAEAITIPVDGGAAPAWVIPADEDAGARAGTHWAIHVHGRGASPDEALRGVRIAGRTGRTSLVISYRGDPGAPVATHERYGFGAAEWRDVSSAMAEARRRGATRITLFGWSMGGTACLLAARHSPHAALIDGIVLDSPAVNWRSLVVHHTQLARAPRLFGWLGAWLLETGLVRSGVPGGIPLRELTPSAFAEHLDVPTLIHCSPGDTFVPEGPARELAALRPDLVTLHRAQGEHVRLWNVEPERWEGVTQAFLEQLPKRSE